MSHGYLFDKVAIVTGAASGLGRAIAERLAREGAKVVLSDRSDAGASVAASINGLFIQGDLAQRDDCMALVRTAKEIFGRVDVLVNNAGYQHISPIEDFPEEVWENMLAVMLTAPFLLTRYCWPMMKRSGWGRVVNIASVHAQIASPYKVAYIAAKHGLLGLTRTAALEGGAHGITVNAICPAYVRTPLVDNQVKDQAKTRGISEGEVIEKVMLEPAAIKRLIEPAEVADFVAYLCSPPAGVMTGAALNMDLGWTAR